MSQHPNILVLLNDPVDVAVLQETLSEHAILTYAEAQRI